MKKVECSVNELQHALLQMNDEAGFEPGPYRLDPFIEETLEEVKGWTPAMWVRLGIIIGERRNGQI